MAIEHDALLIRLTRNVIKTDEHISEKALDDYPINKYSVIINNNTFDNVVMLKEQLKLALQRKKIIQ